ncbi:microcystin degradation protein MlrC [Caldalkalibacillus uzonensis]|uniref:Microcystin degradation protein MlrC n=1 Tax=Caldalkalibacillus uzonensis TaxID=353224 RepID=A0ABU0CYD2_9BACI|nr:M81 family metallopeptidase [Caldalkalibacillus uzonensis]MDQ0341167.1 microcystin degradation protein MlrC [Caldalkalibacillus uzonensis]
MRVAIGQVIHETNTFSTERTTEAHFCSLEWAEGEDIIELHEGVKDYLGGMIDEGRELGLALIPTLSVVAQPSGIIAGETWLKIKERLIDHLKRIGHLDAICLALHGAGVSEQSSDIEGDLLSSIRSTFGQEIPVVATLDLHANMTDQMVDQADLLLGVHLYPHSDEYDRGREAIRRLIDIAKGKIKPCMHLTKIPILIPTSTTLFGPAKHINDQCMGWEGEQGIIDCTFFHGFPYSDTPYTGASVLATSDGDDELARLASSQVAQKIWESRGEFQVSHFSPSEGLNRALQESNGPVIINETSDNPGAGAPGDGTFLLAEMLSKDVPNTCFCHICDPEVANVAHQAGVGAFINVSLGGKTDHLHGSSLPIRAYVKCLTDGQFIQTSPMEEGLKVDLGKSVRLLIGNVDVIVTSLKSQLLDDELLKLHGIDMKRYNVIGIKSSQHFRGFFENKVTKIITVDSLGLSTFNFSKFSYRNICRPVYPLDKIEINAVSRFLNKDW